MVIADVLAAIHCSDVTTFTIVAPAPHHLEPPHRRHAPPPT
jgi:hypothetical protein